jgi:hypothetical protein
MGDGVEGSLASTSLLGPDGRTVLAVRSARWLAPEVRMLGSRRQLGSLGKAGALRRVAFAVVTVVLGLSQAACGCDCEDEPTTPNDNPDCILGGKVFIDANRNGVDDLGETPVQNVTVTVFKCDGSVQQQLLTGLNGLWQIAIPGCSPADRYLIRYTNWPAQYEAGFFGPDSETDIQISQPNDLHNHPACRSPSHRAARATCSCRWSRGRYPGRRPATQPGYVSFLWTPGQLPMYGGVGPTPAVSADPGRRQRLGAG